MMGSSAKCGDGSKPRVFKDVGDCTEAPLLGRRREDLVGECKAGDGGACIGTGRGWDMT